MPGHDRGVFEYVLLVLLAAVVALAVWSNLAGGPLQLLEEIKKTVEPWLNG